MCALMNEVGGLCPQYNKSGGVPPAPPAPTPLKVSYFKDQIVQSNLTCKIKDLVLPPHKLNFSTNISSSLTWPTKLKISYTAEVIQSNLTW